MKKLYFLILCCLSGLIVSAQNNQFLLYSFKGNVTVVEGGVESKAKVGKTFTNNASVKLASGGMVTLICNEAAMFTLTKAGTYPMSRVKDSCMTSTSSVSSNYVKYVWNQMTKSSGSEGSNRKAYMNTVGAVTRSIYPVFIHPRLDSVNYSGGEFPLSWQCWDDDVKEFEFSIFMPDNLGTPFYSKVVGKKKIQVTDFISKLKPGNTYRWTAAYKGEENDLLPLFNYVTKATYEEVLNKIKAQGAAYESPAEQAYRIAFMLEDARYLAEAYQYYMKATIAAPDNALYRTTVMSFKQDYEIK